VPAADILVALNYERSDASSAIVLIDKRSGDAFGRIAVGYKPEAALRPAADQLLVWTQQHLLLFRTFPDFHLASAVPLTNASRAMFYLQLMHLSADQQFLYYGQHQSASCPGAGPSSQPRNCHYSIGVVDLDQARQVAIAQLPPQCTAQRLLPGAAPSSIRVYCPMGSLLEVSNTGAVDVLVPYFGGFNETVHRYPVDADTYPSFAARSFDGAWYLVYNSGLVRLADGSATDLGLPCCGRIRWPQVYPTVGGTYLMGLFDVDPFVDAHHLSAIVRFDPRTRQVVHTYAVPPGQTFFAPEGGDAVSLLGEDGGVQGLDLETGAVLWRVETAVDADALVSSP
jgi:hypothetical protein